MFRPLPFSTRCLLRTLQVLTLCGVLPGYAVAQAHSHIQPRAVMSGAVCRYHVAYRNQGSGDIRSLIDSANNRPSAAPAPANQSVFSLLSLHGDMDITVLKETRVGSLLRCRLYAAHLDIAVNGQKAAQIVPQTLRELQHEVYAERDSRGSIKNIHIDGATGVVARGLLFAILAQSQFVTPAHQATPPARWETTEKAPGGSYAVRYTLLPATPRDPNQHFFKQKLRSAFGPPPNKLMPQERVLTGGSTESWNPTRRVLLDAYCDEEERLVLNKKEVGNSHTTFRMTLARTGKVTAQVCRNAVARSLKLQQSQPGLELTVLRTAAEIEHDAQIAALGTSTWPELCEALRQAATAPPHSDHATLLMKLLACACLHPEVCLAMGRFLVRQPASGQPFALLSLALGNAGTAQAQAALCMAVRSRAGDVAAMQQVLLHLGMVKCPTLPSECVLSLLAHSSRQPDVHTMANLALGMMARNLMAFAPARSKGIVQQLQAALRSARTLEEQRSLLGALGNTGHAEAYALLTRYARDSNVELRVAAVTSMRWQTQSQSLLLDILLHDHDSRVRNEAAFALGFQPMAARSFQTQQQAFYREKEPMLRIALLSNLWKSRAGYPQIQRLVRETTLWDKEETVRKYARQILQQEHASQN